MSSTPVSSEPADATNRNEMERSRLEKMVHEERTSRAAPDHVALMDADPCFHNQLWRERVAQWFYDVLDFLEESRDIAYVGMTVLDRYLAVRTRETSGSLSPPMIEPFDFEILAFTSLFLSIRVCGSGRELQIPELLQLSSSGARTSHIVQAGNIVLKKLSWDQRILTPHMFLKELLELYVQGWNSQNSSRHHISREEALSVFEFASYLVEVSVCDAFFSKVAPSEIAFAALAVAVTSDRTLTLDNPHIQAFLSRFWQVVHQQTTMDIESAHMKSIVSRLLDVYNQSHEAAVATADPKEGRGENLQSESSPQLILAHEDEANINCTRANFLDQDSDDDPVLIPAVSPASFDTNNRHLDQAC